MSGLDQDFNWMMCLQCKARRFKVYKKEQKGYGIASSYCCDFWKWEVELAFEKGEEQVGHEIKVGWRDGQLDTSLSGMYMTS